MRGNPDGGVQGRPKGVARANVQQLKMVAAPSSPSLNPNEPYLFFSFSMFFVLIWDLVGFCGTDGAGSPDGAHAESTQAVRGPAAAWAQAARREAQTAGVHG